MSVKFWWCHTPECPNVGRPVQLPADAPGCVHCGAPLSMAAPGEIDAPNLDAEAREAS